MCCCGRLLNTILVTVNYMYIKPMGILLIFEVPRYFARTLQSFSMTSSGQKDDLESRMDKKIENMCDSMVNTVH